MDDSLRSLFVFETTQLIHEVENIILNAESDHSVLQNKMEDIFRMMHTIKGGAGMLGYSPLQTLTHTLEDLFHYLKDNLNVQYQYTELTELLLTCCDVILKYLDDPSIDTVEYENKALNLLKSLKSNVKTTVTEVSKKIDIHSEKRKLVVFFVGNQMLNIRAFELSNRFNRLNLKNEYFPGFNEENGGDIILTNGARYIFQNDEDYKKASDILANNLLVTSHHIEEPVKEADKQVFIPVAKNKLDKLLDLICEAIDDYNQVKHLLEDNVKADVLAKTFNELQDTIVSTRMTSIKETLNNMKRFAHDVAKTLNKKVNLEINAEDIEIDRQVNEIFFIVLTQIIKNAVDHGIEDSTIRQKHGKTEIGNITISAKLDGRNVIVEVKDDGKGFDKEKIISIALAKNLIQEEDIATLSDSEIYELTYNSGFTTKTKTNEISGRGVGMDIVQNSIRQVRGSIFIDSEKDKYSIVTLVVPLTLTIIEVFVIEVNAYKIAIPVDEIDKIYDINAVAIQGNELNVNNESYRFVDLKQFFKYDKNDIAVILSTKLKRAVALPKILKYAKVIVKPAPDIFSDSLGVNGLVTLDGTDSDVCLVISLHKLVRNMKRGQKNE
jgi:two-component system chemotaxis sensor kinase CheA